MKTFAHKDLHEGYTAAFFNNSQTMGGMLCKGILSFVFLDTVSLSCSGWLQTFSPPSSAVRVLELQVLHTGPKGYYLIIKRIQMNPEDILSEKYPGKGYSYCLYEMSRIANP